MKSAKLIAEFWHINSCVMNLNRYKEFNMKKIFCFASAILILTGVFAAPGGEFWEKKPYKEWNQKECAKLLEDSPWSRALKLTTVGIMDNYTNKTSSDGQQPTTKYQVLFYSAKPIRQATVRMAQINQKYDSLSPEQKQEMDKRSDAFLSADLSNVVVITVSYDINDRNNALELARHWQSQTTDTLKNVVYLSNTKGDKVPVARYTADQGAGRSFQFMFPREVNGKPLLSPQDKSVKLEFTYPVIGGMGDGKAFMEFKAEKMIFEGNIAY
jgi:hypothetical protein